MCPSYRVTREEEHSTRGRAHLLWEMTRASRKMDHSRWLAQRRGQSIRSISASPAKDARAIARWASTSRRTKPNFSRIITKAASRPLQRLRLRQHRPLGAAGLARSGPGESRPRSFRSCATSQSSSPAFPQQRQHSRHSLPQTFQTAGCTAGRRRNGRHRPSRIGACRSFSGPTPSTTISSINRQGRRRSPRSRRVHVSVPRANLCCGRPLYDFGMLDRAKRLLLEILDALSPEIEAGIPIVGLEPSCVAVFRDELLQSVPQRRARPSASQPDLSAQRISRQHCRRLPHSRASRARRCSTATATTSPS